MNQPQGLNLYPYVMGGPTRYVDPDGLDWWYQGDPNGADWFLGWAENDKSPKAQRALARQGFKKVTQNQEFKAAYKQLGNDIVARHPDVRNFDVAFRKTVEVGFTGVIRILKTDAGPGYFQEMVNATGTDSSSGSDLQWYLNFGNRLGAELAYNTANVCSFGLFGKEDQLLGQYSRGSIDGLMFTGASAQYTAETGLKFVAVTAAASAAAPIGTMGAAGTVVAAGLGGASGQFVSDMIDGQLSPWWQYGLTVGTAAAGGGVAAKLGVGRGSSGITQLGISADGVGTIANVGSTTGGGTVLGSAQKGVTSVVPEVGVAESAAAREIASSAGEAAFAPPIKAGSAGGETAGKAFPPAVKDAARAENPLAICVYCRRKGTATQVDHATPRARGGNATLDNAQLACPHCNPSKGARRYPVNPPPGYRGEWPPPWW